MLVFPIGKWTKMCQGTRGRTPQKLVYVALKGAFKKRKKGCTKRGRKKDTLCFRSHLDLRGPS